jgi:hypothetical protein
MNSFGSAVKEEQSEAKTCDAFPNEAILYSSHFLPDKKGTYRMTRLMLVIVIIDRVSLGIRCYLEADIPRREWQFLLKALTGHKGSSVLSGNEGRV